MISETLRAQFQNLYGREPRVFSAPGRVNLIGEHTDYNDGFVLPMAIDRRTFVAVSPRDDRIIRARSTAEAGGIEFEIGREYPGDGDCGRYVYGVVECLRQDEFDLRGADLLIASEVPIGAGLSSSAALEISVGFALLNISEQPVELPIDLVDLALAAQRAEHHYAGTQSGIMDQYIACLGIKSHALLIDCRSLEYRAVPIDLEHARVVVCNSMIKHDLAAGEYNQRRAECEEGVRRLAANLPRIQALRDVGIDDFDLYAGSLPEIIRRRCNHVITENARTLAAVEALEGGDLARFGKLMYASHESLRDDYEVSSPELDLLVAIASRCDGVFGARMTGGGFGGCTVNLVAADFVDKFITTISREYETETGLRPDCYVCQASAGVREEH
ncbi:MAG: Galactokinase [Acidobacteria bacterium]|nr:Galactokinase [Acidobacteriota bacterium]